MEVTVNIFAIVLIVVGGAGGLVVAFLSGRLYEKAKLLKNNDLTYRLARARARLAAAEGKIVKLKKRRDRFERLSLRPGIVSDQGEAHTKHTQANRELTELKGSLPGLRDAITRLEGEQQIAQIAG